MNRSDRIEHRLPPRAIPLFAVTAIRELLPILVVALVSGRLDLQELGFWLFAGTAATLLGLLNWYTTRFAFLADHVSLKSGLLFREHRQLPWDRIQNLSVTRGPLHRLLGIGHLRIESASGTGSEINLNGMTATQVDELRQRFESLQAASAAVAAKPAGIDPSAAALSLPYKQLGTAELVRLGLIENRGMVVIGAALGLLIQTDGLQRQLFKAAERLEPLLDRLSIDRSDPLGQALLWGVLLLCWLLLVRLFSVAHAIWTHHGFTLRLQDDRLLVDEGLATRRQLSGRIPRIQRISVHEGPLHQLFGRVSVRIATAAQVAINESSTQLRDVLPIGTPAEARQLLPVLLPTWDWRQLRFEALPSRALARAYVTLVPLWLLGLLAASMAGSGWTLAVTTLGCAHLLQQFFLIRNTSISISTDGVVLLRTGWSRRAEFLPTPRIQGRGLSQGPLDRAFGLARVSFDVAGGGPMSWLTLPPLLTARGLEILRQLEPADAGQQTSRSG